MFRGVDRAAFGIALVGRLRSAGVEVGLGGVAALTDALDVVPARDRARLYWTARICLVHRHADLAAFDAVFRAVFSDAVLALDPHARRIGSATEAPAESYGRVPGRAGAPEAGGGAPWLTTPAVAGVDAQPDDDVTLLVPDLMPDRLAGHADVAFDQLDTAHLALLEVWLSAALLHWPRRRSRRMTLDGRGSAVALRATMARSRRTGWDAAEIVRRRPVWRPRRVVMLCDVSRSMRGYATAYVHFMRAVATVADAEVFAFATRLTRLTPALRLESPASAIEAATRDVDDRFGGTRIATAVTSLLRSHRGESVRGGIVILASDGWDSDPPAELTRAMARLRRRAHAVIWLNPRAAAADYAPLAAGMAAALPFCDALLPAHTPRAMADVIEAISSTV